MRRVSITILALAGALALFAQAHHETVRFVILGDRTGEAQRGVYEQIWQETAADHPDFVINVGDTIQGENDATVDAEWTSIQQFLKTYTRFPFFYTPGNHDVWNDTSAAAYKKYTQHDLHYSFDRGPVHIAVLDNSRSDALATDELSWLDQDLAAHKTAPVKFVFSHRPSWIMNAVLQSPDFPLQQLAEKYHVRYVVAGHIHQMLHFELNGVTYLSIASSGGHLRGKQRYEDGWFFEHTLVTVHESEASFEIKEAAAPHGQGRISRLSDWGTAGLIAAEQNAH